MEKLLTILVPAYNVEGYIERCLDSFLDKELLELIEVLVVDDGGQDTTLEIAKAYSKKYKQIIPVHKENGGHGSVINYGIENAKGKYLKVVDGDDWIDSKALLNVLKRVKNLDVDVIFSDYIKEIKYNNTKQYYSLEKCFIRDEVSLLSENHYQKGIGIDIHSLIYKVQMLRDKNIKMMEKTFYEDTQFVLFPLANDLKIIYIKDPIYHYFIGRPEQSVSNTSRLKHLNDQFRIIDSVLTFYEENNIKDQKANIKKIWETRMMGTLKFRYSILINEHKKVKKELIAYDQYLKEKNREIYEKIAEQNHYIKAMRKRNYQLMSLTKLSMKIENKMKSIYKKVANEKE